MNSCECGNIPSIDIIKAKTKKAIDEKENEYIQYKLECVKQINNAAENGIHRAVIKYHENKALSKRLIDELLKARYQIDTVDVFHNLQIDKEFAVSWVM